MTPGSGFWPHARSVPLSTPRYIQTMHWHAIRQSLTSAKEQTGGHEEDFDGSPSVEVSTGPDVRLTSPPESLQSHLPDDTGTASPLQALCGPSRSAREPSPRPNENEILPEYFQVSIPSSTIGHTTFAHERALRNRVQASKLAQGGEYDIRAYTPTFVHDCLMLPGSLASTLGKNSPEDCIRRMTPALLPGFITRLHPQTQQPCLEPSPNAGDYVQGMLVLGQGKHTRNVIHQTYPAGARRVKVRVEIDITVPIAPGDRAYPLEHWRLRRTQLWAHAWLWVGARCDNTDSVSDKDNPSLALTIEACISGTHETESSRLLVDPAGLGQESDFIEVDVTGEQETPHELVESESVTPRIGYDSADYFADMV